MWRTLLSALVSGLLLSLSIPIARAQTDEDDKEQARSLANEGADLFERGAYQAAYDKLSRADELVSVPTISIAVARTLVALHRLVEARDQYEAAAGMHVDPELPAHFFKAQSDAVRAAGDELAALLPKIPQLTIRTQGAAPETLTVNDAPVDVTALPITMSLDPKEHVLVATAGQQRWNKSVVLKRGARENVTIELSLPAPAPPVPVPLPPPPVDDRSDTSASTYLGWAAVGLGAASFVVSAATYGAAASEQSALAERCPARVCRESQAGGAVVDDIERYDRLRWASVATGVIGGVLTAGGVALLVFVSDESEQAPASVTLSLGFPNVGVHGRF